jgi:hypothetical protein
MPRSVILAALAAALPIFFTLLPAGRISLSSLPASAPAQEPPANRAIGRCSTRVLHNLWPSDQ